MGVRFVAAAGALLAGVAASSGQTTDRAFDAWWQKLTRAGAAGPSIDGLNLRFEYAVWVPWPSTDEIEALRARVKGRPDHPDRRRLAALESALRWNGWVSQTVSVWRWGHEWRINREGEALRGGGVGYFDAAWADGLAWQLNDSQLITVAQTRTGETPYRIEGMGAALGGDVDALLSGGLAALIDLGIVLIPTLEGDRWRVQARGTSQKGSGYEVEAEGRWQADKGWGTVDRVVSRVGGSGLPTVATMSGWEVVEGQPMAAEAVWALTDGTPVARRRLISAGRYGRQEFRALVREPRAHVPDPERGDLSFRAVADFRGRVPVFARVDPQDRSRLVVYEGPEPPGVRMLRPLGWVLAVLLVGMLAVVKLIRTRRVAA
jgi:hypothetical protein